MLTVIITTYNSERTLHQCLDSILKPNLDFISEIIVCDDCSSDRTLKILDKYEKQYSFLKVIFHQENLGGGAARNSAIRFASNEYLYVLDSDDIVHPSSLKMLFQKIKGTDISGVHYSSAYYFLKFPNFYFNIDNYHSVFGNEITLMKVLENATPCVNFLFTKKGWEKAGGYPEDYSWDTQGFTFKFLLNNECIKIIKNTRYYHRKFLDKSSYYDREEESGRSKINAWLAIENIEKKIGDRELFYLIYSDFFSKHDFLELFQLILKNPSLIDDKYSNSSHEKLLYEFRLSIRKYKLGEYSHSKMHAENALKFMPESFLLIYNLHRSLLALSGDDIQRVKLKAFDELVKNKIYKSKINDISYLTRLKYYLKSILFPVLHIFGSSDN